MYNVKVKLRLLNRFLLNNPNDDFTQFKLNFVSVIFL